ncbi:hypothetical protein ACHAXR_005553 [Thalassiosira sp. AJA248-18]
MANHNYRIQQQHIAMARKRQRRQRQAQSAAVAHGDAQGHHNPNAHHQHGNGITVNIRQINAGATGDEGVLYTHRITERRGRPQKSTLANLFRRRNRHHHNLPDNMSLGSFRSHGSISFGLPYSRRNSNSNNPRTINTSGIIGSTLPATPRSPPPQSDTLRGFRTFFGKHQKQYTVASKKKYFNLHINEICLLYNDPTNLLLFASHCCAQYDIAIFSPVTSYTHQKSKFLNWIDKHHMNFVEYFCHSNEVDNNVYRPSTLLYRYIDWTFTASFTGVFMTFMFIYCVLCLVFGGLLLVAGNAEPNCIVASGAPFGADTPHTKFSDAFALSWTTFTTVGYGMTYTTTGSDFGDTKPHECSWVVFLSTTEAFLGLLFAGMCAAILFGKVNRVQSHANLIFCNAVCLQYEEMEDEIDDPDYGESERSRGAPPTPVAVPDFDDDEESGLEMIGATPVAPAQSQEESKFVDQFNGCPILKFQVVNELCNREGGELVDCIMKVVGIKFKGPDGRVTHSQYVRVNLVDFEHPFLSRVWHGVHILDSTSPLLTDRARQRIRENNGSWPSTWFDPEVIRSKLEFHDLIVTVAGISNVSAVTVHAYKRYKIGDVLIGYNFAPIVFRDTETGKLDVDLSMCNDVREQYGIRGEDLSIRRSGSKESLSRLSSFKLKNKLESTIRIKKSKSGDALGSVTSHHSGGSKRSGAFSPVSSRAGSPTPKAASPEKVPFDPPVFKEPNSEPLSVIIPLNDPISPLEMEMEEPETSEDEVILNKNAVFRDKNPQQV